jgi:hypothetical protein
LKYFDDKPLLKQFLRPEFNVAKVEVCVGAYFIEMWGTNRHCRVWDLLYFAAKTGKKTVL